MPILSAVDEVLVHGSPQDKPSLIVKVEHVVLVALSPMLPPMLLDVLFNLSSIPILPLSSGDPGAVLVHAHVVLPAVLYVQPVNLTIEPVNLFFLVYIVFRLGAVIGEPCKLRRIEEGSNSDSIGAAILIDELLDILAKLHQ